MTSEGIVGSLHVHLWTAGHRNMYHHTVDTIIFKISLLSHFTIMLHISVALHLFTLRKYLTKLFDKYFFVVIKINHAEQIPGSYV